VGKLIKGRQETGENKLKVHDKSMIVCDTLSVPHKSNKMEKMYSLLDIKFTRTR